ncbi:hypothetical protein C8F01DRAFT_1149696 [Mycena amicta]|nr:hypothetical protein C8F01DRAFT_1149696 [Mycena amicta]
MSDQRASSPDSLFDEPFISPASLTPPPIPGLFFSPSLLLPDDIADRVAQFCLQKYFTRPNVNQIMLFGEESIPRPLLDLLSMLSSLLQPHLPGEVHALLFPTTPKLARQAILNLYKRGEGITPHIDLLGRYADGIVGVSFGSGCVMRFDLQEGQPDTPPLHLFLPKGSIVVLSSDARYKWSHGIEKRTEDVVVGEDGALTVVDRGVRLSVTFRWLLPGADIVGEDEA